MLVEFRKQETVTAVAIIQKSLVYLLYTFLVTHYFIVLKQEKYIDGNLYLNIINVICNINFWFDIKYNTYEGIKDTKVYNSENQLQNGYMYVCTRAAFMLVTNAVMCIVHRRYSSPTLYNAKLIYEGRSTPPSPGRKSRMKNEEGCRWRQ